MEELNGKHFFANDGSFLERFKQLQQEQGLPQDSNPPAETPGTAEDAGYTPPSDISKSLAAAKKTSFNASRFKPKPVAQVVSTGGKLAFSLKPKARPAVNALKLDDENEEEDDGENDRAAVFKKLKSELNSDTSPEHSRKTSETIPAPPSDPKVRKIADKLASFVAKNGRQFEDVTRQKNPGNTPFRFLFDVTSADYKYYEYRIAQEEKILAVTRMNQSTQIAGRSELCSQDNQRESAVLRHLRYQTPAAALYIGTDDWRWPSQSSAGTPLPSDTLAMMEFYAKRAAEEDLQKPAKLSQHEMPSPLCLQSQTAATTGIRGHHMGDYIPQEELENFYAKCNDAMAQKAGREAAQRAKIQADNVGHKLLSKMGWKEGEGLGSGKSGRADPVQAGAVKLNNLGVGAEHPGEVTPDDDIYEQYKKRMMLGYRFRPNPLNNPRKSYY